MRQKRKYHFPRVIEQGFFEVGNDFVPTIVVELRNQYIGSYWVYSQRGCDCRNVFELLPCHGNSLGGHLQICRIIYIKYKSDCQKRLKSDFYQQCMHILVYNIKLK